MHDHPSVDVSSQSETFCTGQKSTRLNEVTAFIEQVQQHFMPGNLFTTRFDNGLRDQHKLIVLDGILKAPRLTHVEGHRRYIRRIAAAQSAIKHKVDKESRYPQIAPAEAVQTKMSR